MHQSSSSSAQPAAWRKRLFGVLSTLYLALIHGAPVLLWAAVYQALAAPVLRLIWLFASPLVYTVLFLLISGSLSLFHQAAIIPGRFLRDTATPLYFHRRLYGLCWTALYYCKPVYALCLALPWLKWITFRLFGYRGCMNFTVYPDTWIRDLPLLTFGNGAYISNRSTLGTNIAMASGHLLVDRVEVGDHALVGHLTMLAPGVRLGSRAEVAVGCAIGIGTTVGERASVLPTCTLEHGVVISARAVIGTSSYVGSKAIVGEGVRLPPATLLPRRAIVNTKAEVGSYLSSAIRAAAIESRQESLLDD